MATKTSRSVTRAATFFRIDLADWSSTAIADVRADPYGALATAGEGRFLDVGVVALHEYSFAVRDAESGALITELPFERFADGVTEFHLWSIAPNSGDP